ncbi:MAG: DUF1559 domain-containing protein [Gemmataceae bacterium]|nr:DUF1559 domain-containing protein [Gemmataceae bacterium]MCI0739810.1 DUF1559 domain-containing protein [Gemmataceae bacterium]
MKTSPSKTDRLPTWVRTPILTDLHKSQRPGQNRSSIPRVAFTLIELLLVLGIISILLSLILAGVVKVREASNQAVCINNLRQIGLAMHLHQTRHGVFPSNGGWDGKQTIQSKDGKPVVVSVTEHYLNLTFKYGVGEPTKAPRDQPGSWAYAILPYLNLARNYDKRVWHTPVEVYVCPSRRLPVAQPANNDKHGDYEGGGWLWARTDYAGNAHVVPNRPKTLRPENIKDGKAQTIMAGENAMHPADYQSGTWYWDEPFFVGGSGGTQRGFGTKPGEGAAIVRDVPGMGFTFRYNWGSAHAGAANFLFADGSVRSLSYELRPQIVQAMLTPAGRDDVGK